MSVGNSEDQVLRNPYLVRINLELGGGALLSDGL